MNPSQPEETFADIRTEPDALIVPDEVLSAYNMDVRGVEPLATNSFNVHFRVHTGSASYDLRRSNRPHTPTNLLYEADLLTHLRGKGFDLGPEIVPTGDGRKNVWHQDSGWTMFRWMGDGPKIARQEMSTGRVEDAARTLALIHEAASDFSSSSRRGDWPIFAGPEEWAGRWMRRAEILAARLGADSSDLLRLAERATKELGDIELGALRATVCHADYRPVNLRFEDDSVAVVFDFDTAFRAPRLLDLGGTVTRFAREGGNPRADVESGSNFLRAYDDVSPLTPQEWSALPAFIRWRLVRDVVVYFDRWWITVEDACKSLFDGAADAIVKASRR